MKGVFIQTFGCQMNVHDSQRIAALLRSEGYRVVSSPEQADIILVNTCSVREKPGQKVMSAVGQFAQLRSEKPTLVIGVGGCFAKQEGANLLKKNKNIDIVFGPDNIPDLPELIEKLEQDREPIVETEFDPAENVRFIEVAPEVLSPEISGMITIMKGCDKYCSFCIVPHVRGRERYRPPEQILKEAETLVESGAREIILLGQSVTSYRWREGDKEWNLAKLLRAVDKIPGLHRLRFTSPYPRDFTDELIDCFDGSLPTLCEHVHLPFQSGSDEILYRMNRRHTRDQYLEWVAKLRSKSPNLAISADVIVGFPGETEEDFQKTMELIEEVRFDQLYSFKYSPRPYTPARRKEQVPEEEKSRRLAILQERQREISFEKNKALEGSVQEVLVEGPAKRGRGLMSGRTRGNKVVNFEGEPSLRGRLALIKITEARHHSLFGKLVGFSESDPGPLA